MTPEAQRIAIAKVCGYTDEGPNCPPGKFRFWRPGGYKTDSVYRLPNYLNDLNAMHEAEKLLKSEQHFTFQVELARVINTTTYPLNFALLHATAAQRAEAFLRTLNLWKP